MADDMHDDNQEEDFATMFERYTNGMHQDLRVGDKIRGRIVAVGKESLFVDTGAKADGAVDRSEFEDENGDLTCQTGDEVELYVTRITESEILLSKAVSGEGGIELLRDAQAAEIPVEGKVRETCKGGFHVEILQRRAFCPISQMDLSRIDAPETFVGQQLSFLITRIEEGGRNIVVSRRRLLEGERAAMQREILENLAVGSEWEGHVTRILPFGAFVDISAGIEGLVHVSELSWARVDKPESVVTPGDAVRVKVIGISPEEGKPLPKISLSMKQVADDPWNAAADTIKTGDIVSGTVTNCAAFGAFVSLAPGVEGLVHISELSHGRRINKVTDVVSPGDGVTVRVKDIDPVTRRISLSLKDAGEDPFRRFTEDHPVGSRVTAALEKKETFGYFFQLAAGVTGLLPLSKINQSENRAALEKLKPGDATSLLVGDVDRPRRRISLSTGGGDDAETNWKGYQARAEDTGGGFHTLADKLKQAMKEKE